MLATNLQTELLNRKWIAGMKEHGYAGAGHAAELVKNTFGWSVTRRGSISDQQWKEIYSVYVEDKYNLGVQQWLEKTNPHALQEMAATMLEASRKGYWNAGDETVRKLSKIYADLAVKYGDSGGLVSGGNKRLEEFVSKTLTAPGAASDVALAMKMSKVLAGRQPRRPPPAPPNCSKSPAAACNCPNHSLGRTPPPHGYRLP